MILPSTASPSDNDHVVHARFMTARRVWVRASSVLVVVLACALLDARRASAQWLSSFDVGPHWPLSRPQSQTAGVGVAGAAGVRVAVGPYVLPGLRLVAGWLQDGDPPRQYGLEDPGPRAYVSALATVRLRPAARVDDVRRGVGPWVELGAGAVRTGPLWRAGLELAAGWGFPVGAVAIGPALRYGQVIQPADPLSDEDARLLTLGAEVVFFDARPPPPRPPPPPPDDSDYDGIVDPADGCVRAPEDRDGFEDEDGCPEPDNDADGVLDGRDACGTEPEDRDGFEDEDGCPEPDNDADGIADAADRCPNEPEVVNAVDDGDGCPDEGLIALVEDRIVLEERVLFDFERARVKSSARPVIEAIVTLIRQHPEWFRVRIEGHADARGDARYNLELSRRRAQNVVRALVEAGAAPELFVAEGYGASRLRDLGSSEEAHARNRRVEFVVIARRSPTGQVVHREPPRPAPMREGEPVEGAGPLGTSDMTFTLEETEGRR
ncbi:MAG: OmpA family protein [Myxococcota bacterium]|nr:OmpA family protein [Myxococcota bacterium]MDW8363176.1 OmpA family protein [Myxococcales bacterium]